MLNLVRMEHAIMPERHSLNKLQVPAQLPVHVAIIMDGNGRWAAKRGLPRAAGHRAGVIAVRRVVELCLAAGIKHLTLYTFSSENWSRPRTEVTALFSLFRSTIRKELADLCKNEIRLRAIGRLDQLDPKDRAILDEGLAKTATNNKMDLILALSYGGRGEIVEAVREIARKVAKGELTPDQIDPEIISNHLYTAQYPDPDLVIRTSGELRLSNFLPWQTTYSEFFITETFWPDFGEKEFQAALEAYSRRERRFGR